MSETSKKETVTVEEVFPLRTLRSKDSKKLIDCYQQFRETFKEVPPLAVDPETGDILNKSHEVQLVKCDPIDIQDEVDSYFDSVDLKTNIIRLSRQGIDPSKALEIATPEIYADISQLPDNINDWKGFFAEKAEQKAQLDIQIKEAQRKAQEAEQAKQKSLDDAIASKIAQYMANKENK